MDGVFCRFESYHFESDAKFAEGLRSVEKAQRGGAEESGLLDLKLFYYNRFVEPIDPSSYKHWRSSNGTSDSRGDVRPTEAHTNRGGHFDVCRGDEAGPGGKRGARSEQTGHSADQSEPSPISNDQDPEALGEMSTVHVIRNI
ncbi:hypothetical protein NQD34_005630 [Periophthalmus magnuspinnatus]|nr:hypothetical protein NQD34_005630 [Periophthalmus magnuspinnatus]